MEKKILLIGNPVAGRGMAHRVIAEVVHELQQRGCTVEAFLTRAAGDANHRARRVTPDVSTVVVAGGDGTFNEVLNGLPDPSAIPVSMFPLGTANILAHELSLPKKPKAAAEAVDQGRVRWLDMGLAKDRRFLMLVSAGLDAMVSKEISQRRGTRLGYLGYLLPVLRVLARYRSPDLRVTVDGREGGRGAFVLVSNTRNYGGIFTFADRARCDSGHLDVCIFPKGDFLALLRYYFAAFRGRLSMETDVTYLEGRSIRIESGRPIAVQVDGDPFGTTPIGIDIMPSSVPIIVPHNGHSNTR
ncbi:MAG: YegS/Rv2252/BmrU family lipid kinase [Proteobacteria bacterium]|nr:YegS/Rv2252/BmrU family lipid kinase [Pseudomonadota bacterium]